MVHQINGGTIRLRYQLKANVIDLLYDATMQRLGNTVSQSGMHAQTRKSQAEY
jgi:lipopolysaccharide export system protein LptA